LQEWKQTPGFAGYRVSNDGRVRSLERGELRARPDRYGYLRVRLVGPGGRVHQYVHRLVLAAFIGPRPDGTGSRHLNGDPTDNRASNLAWGTQLQNMRDRDRHGTVARGSRNGRSKLSASDVGRLRELRRAGASYRRLARLYQVDASSVRAACSGRTWGHVE
jgi:hypothetical protein